MLEVIVNYRGLKHRQQYLGNKNNIHFINDSKATNAISTACALSSFENIFLLLGGIAKSGGLEDITPFVSRIKKAFVFGEAKESFADFLQKHNVEYELTNDLQQATHHAYEQAERLNTEINIVLSPACASFDQWKNFEERGECFIALAESIMAN